MLTAERSRVAVTATLLAALVFSAWLVWMVLVPVSVQLTSDQARLEVASAAHPVQPVVTGRVKSSNLELGRLVHRGDALVELEAETQHYALAEAKVRLASLQGEVAVLEGAIAAYEDAAAAVQHSVPLALADAKVKLERAASESELASSESDRGQKLFAAGVLDESDLSKRRALARQQALLLQGARITIPNTRWDRAIEHNRLRGQIQELKRQRVQLDGEIASLQASLPRLGYDVELRTLRATVDGRLADVERLPVGAVLQAGQRCAYIVPEGRFRIDARYAPSMSVGRVRSGQTARVRLDAFPWTQYGVVEARVSRVGSEAREGYVRVELEALRVPSRIQPQHGMQAAVDVEIERETPWHLLLWLFGALENQPKSSAHAAP
ncbi:MAG TPA: HlyD family efflux transporter periplasmic adaptor subunit [Polyangiaceae bacterium]|nr:HlyD family efflux transporter periplasmic adaptor subunit [Polyangiaceae bacterium]